MRYLFAREIIAAAKLNPKIIVLSGDFGYKLFGELEANPSQYRNCGCAEQSTVSIAAGLAMGGYFPVVATITPFIAERAFEQIRIDICEQKLPVILMGYSDYPGAGSTHQGDVSRKIISSMRPNIHIFEPETETRLKEDVALALRLREPCFFFLKKRKV